MSSEGRVRFRQKAIVEKEIFDPVLRQLLCGPELERRKQLWLELNAAGFTAPFEVKLHRGILVLRSVFVPGRDLIQAPSLSAVLAGARSLHKLHSLGVLHGDISPGNLIVGMDGGAWIDWTAADRMGQEFYRGTFGQISPEYDRLGRYTRASELFALGALARFVLRERAEQPPFRKFIAQALHPLPHLRFSTAEIFGHALEDAIRESAELPHKG